ncbi:NADH-quinone oxidoreductase subunit A [Methylococcus capsulatus]|uniref:NADH-quinone oxidoreductase subunit A n=1 Tax=Methylococcus capsulatus TaxID=414 RepID=UPI001C52B290|nr:NADH-quinone oxidoreductase subunit A [Methylococcus capsulatus]QXP87931.1 NADH-quinone oxidoreductase subunit A [Methylococcus capsulatus]QXP92328.1 NADH-quinone oxidoreductase subunit A [Methylococcus capsulatus]UQN12955.1 NADH-quinone oxidoreductase subunit A [Methylococcus capsulatus]
MSSAGVPHTDLWPLLLYFELVLVVVGTMLVLPPFLGERRTRRTPATEQPYESGIVAVGSSQLRFSVRFYLIAIFFVIFDLEAVFIFAWAIAFRESGWPGYIEILIFIGVLVATLVYLWRIGALDWRTPRQRSIEATIHQ